MSEMKEYTQLTKSERQEIYLLMNKGYSYGDIAKALNRSKSTISREVRRNRTRGRYEPSKAEHKRDRRRRYCKIYLKKIREYPELEKYIRTHIKLGWSPEQVSGRWNKEDTIDENITISPLTIYKYIYSGIGNDLSFYLASKRHTRKKRKEKKTKRQLIPHRVWIDDRPNKIEEKTQIGNFEGDTVVSKRGDKNSLLVLLDRYSRYVFVTKVKDKKPRRIFNEIDRIANIYNINSITFDNGIEFQQHYKLNCDTYFCHPYSSWEKGAVEYANRLIRRYIPKKTYIKDYSQTYVQQIAQSLNHTPRKCLNYKTPYEVFFNSNSPNYKNLKCCT